MAYKGSAKVASTVTGSPENKMATMESAKSEQMVGNGNVKKTGYETPSADVNRYQGSVEKTSF